MISQEGKKMKSDEIILNENKNRHIFLYVNLKQYFVRSLKTKYRYF